MDPRRYDQRQLTPAPKGRVHWAGALIGVILVAAAGSALWLYLQPTWHHALTLTRASFASLPEWEPGNSAAALAAFRRSCTVTLRLPPDQPMGGAGYAGTARDWHAACTGLPRDVSDAAARKWFESAFVPFAVSAGAGGSALFTGYYEPEIFARRTRGGNYTTPIYGAPRDLVTADLGLFRNDLAGIHLSGHVTTGRFVPYPARAEIDSVGLNNAPVLLYATDPVAVFFLHIQGSGRAHLEDGSMLRLAYAAQNGRPYTPIGRTLIAKRDLDRAHMSMQAIREWLHAHPGEAKAAMETDKSYVFFRELPIGNPQLGSPGTEGVPLTPEASIAVDSSLHALGVPMYVLAEAPATGARGAPLGFTLLCVAQDTGGAIKGPARADIFWGFGRRAEVIAGHMKSNGSLYVLLPKILAARIGARFQTR